MTAIFPDLEKRLVNCRGVLIDSNILIDLATEHPIWADWSAKAVAECADHARLIINPIVYAEVSISYLTLDELDSALPADSYARHALPWEAAYLAGKAYLKYRQRGVSRVTPIPDFYIGAHAAVERFALLTRDAARYRTYFPVVEVLAPQA
jgi:predicted nucleic acid-binding protein